MVQQRQVLLGLTPFVELCPEPVVGQSEACGREQVVAIRIVGERPRLAHQRVDHMPVMHRVLVPPHQPRQRAGELIGVPDLDAVGVESGFHPFADQPAVDRVGAAVDADQAPRIDPATHLPATVQTHRRQSLQRRDLFGEALSSGLVANGHDPVQEVRVLLATDEVPAATQQQRLIDGGLEVVVRRLGVAVLVRLPGVDPLARQAVVIQQVAIPGLELPRRRQVIHGRAEAVTAVPPGHTTEFP
jgi:hypothetical protein